MRGQFLVEAYDVPVNYRPDVCIIGAGPAGMASAVAAARLDLSVLIIEKYGFCGGATVAGLSGTICGLYSNGKDPEQIVFGFAGEFYNALRAKNGVCSPVKFGNTFLVPHDSLKWKELADDLLLQSRCNILYHTSFLKAYTNPDGRIDSLLLKGQEGQFAVKPRYVIDASGDAEVIHSINGQTFFGNNGIVQTPTMIFKMGNVDLRLFHELDLPVLYKQINEADMSGSYQLPRHHVYLFPLPNSGEVLCNMTKITYKDGTVPLGTISKDITYAEIEGRKQAREYARFLIDKVEAFGNAYMADTGVQVGIRQTRSVQGMAKLMNEDVVNARKSKHSISFSAWPMEIHNAGEVKIVNLENDYYDIPFETLVPLRAVNYLVAGRCLSAEHEALASARVTAQCFGMGYAAGAACGLMLRENITASALSGMMVTDWMKQNNLKCTNEQ